MNFRFRPDLASPAKPSMSILTPSSIAPPDAPALNLRLTPSAQFSTRPANQPPACAGYYVHWPAWFPGLRLASSAAFPVNPATKFRFPYSVISGDLKVSRTHFLRLGSQRAHGLRRLPHRPPVWRACLRLAPAATPSSSRRRANPRLFSEAIALQQCRPTPPSACAAGWTLRPCLR
jgi:hypothetical protein